MKRDHKSCRVMEALKKVHCRKGKPDLSPCFAARVMEAVRSGARTTERGNLFPERWLLPLAGAAASLAVAVAVYGLLSYQGWQSSIIQSALLEQASWSALNLGL